ESEGHQQPVPLEGVGQDPVQPALVLTRFLTGRELDGQRLHVRVLLGPLLVDPREPRQHLQHRVRAPVSVWFFRAEDRLTRRRRPTPAPADAQGEEDGARGVSRVGDGTEGFPRQKNGPWFPKVLRSFYAKFTVFFRVRPGLVPAKTFDPTFGHLQQPC